MRIQITMSSTEIAIAYLNFFALWLNIDLKMLTMIFKTGGVLLSGSNSAAAAASMMMNQQEIKQGGL